MIEINFVHSLIADTYEEQANSQGYTFGEQAEIVEKVGYGLKFLYAHDCISQSEFSNILKKFSKLMIKYLEPLDKAESEDNNGNNI